MKREFIVLLVCLCLAFVLTAGCTTPVTTPVTTPAATSHDNPATTTPAVTVMPDLVGTWNGTSRGYVDASGYQVADMVIMMNVVEQNGRLFKGQLSFPENGALITKEFAGVIGADRKTIDDVEYPGGFSDGIVISADEIELIFRDQAKPSTITIDSLKRSTASDKTATPVVQPMPVLLGKWNGSSIGYIDTSGYQVARDVLVINITEQNGRLFKGQVSFMLNKTPVTKNFAGVIGRDGRTLKTVENPDGFSDGVILSADEIELTFRDNVDPSRVVIDSLRRSTVTTPGVTFPASVMPRIAGNWSGVSMGYMKTASGYQVIKGTMAMNVTDQDDRLFKGIIQYVINGSPVTKEFAGVFGRDGMTIATVEYPDGFSNGVIISSDEIQLLFRNTENPSDIAIDTFKRSK
ncbi:MAG: hypothetical protein MUF37_07630 [Methanoregulaceae archaeon]|nr:hypothetical protein [Methanoregulaceae archaeon]